jgi:outer membrane biogenesis lipoprotein LolB
MRKLLVIAAILLTGCAPMTPEQAARYDATFQNSIQQYQQGIDRRQAAREQIYYQQQQPWPSQVNHPTRTTCKPNYLNPSQLDCISR